MSTTVKPLSLNHPDGLGSVHFVWNDDRFGHSIAIGQFEVFCVAGSDHASWPDSPPIQQLSIETIEGRDVALGVGCAGTSHWSLSIEPTQDGFHFDWACRAKESPNQLGTTYDPNAKIVFEPQIDATASVDSNKTKVEPSQPLSGADTYRWQYKVRLG